MRKPEFLLFSTTAKRVTFLFISVALFVLSSLGPAFASSISKTFEFGPGTPFASSVVRTFAVPCGRQVAAVVKHKRSGSSGATGIAIQIELREPDTAPNVEGPLVQSKLAQATTTEQTTTIFSPSSGSTRGCALPWRVRVKADKPPALISGTIRIDYDGTAQTFSIPFTGFLLKGESKTINFGSIAGFAQGNIEITANWHHQVTTVIVGPNPIQLRIELVDPNGTTVQSITAWSSNEIRTNLTPKFRINFKNDKCLAGQWKLKITNINAVDTVGLDGASPKFTPGC